MVNEILCLLLLPFIKLFSGYSSFTSPYDTLDERVKHRGEVDYEVQEAQTDQDVGQLGKSPAALHEVTRDQHQAVVGQEYYKLVAKFNPELVLLSIDLEMKQKDHIAEL